MEWAVALNYWDNNPCSRIGPCSARSRISSSTCGRCPVGAWRQVIEKVRASKVTATVKRAFEFLVWTAASSGEVRGAEWAEINTDEHVWTVPATRTKLKREHRVPLTRRTEQILDAARAAGNGGPLVFPSACGKRVNDMALSALLKTLDVPAVPHGFRSTFRDWAAEETNHPRVVGGAHRGRPRRRGDRRRPRPGTSRRSRSGRAGARQAGLDAPRVRDDGARGRGGASAPPRSVRFPLVSLATGRGRTSGGLAPGCRGIRLCRNCSGLRTNGAVV